MKSSPFNGPFLIKYPFMVEDPGYSCGYHCGIDLKPLGRDWTILPINDGPIVLITTNDAYGNHVVQRLPEGYFAFYSHLASMSVKVGDKLISGKGKIGVMGSSGHSTGPHLDLRICKTMHHSNNPADYISPAEYLGFANTDELVVDLSKKEEEEMLDNLVIYSDGDIGAAIILSQKLGCPMIQKNSADKYQASKKYWLGVQGTNDTSNVYILGSNRTDTAKKVLV